MMSVLSLSLGGGLCASRKVGQGEVRGFTERVVTAWLVQA